MRWKRIFAGTPQQKNFKARVHHKRVGKNVTHRASNPQKSQQLSTNGP